MLNLTHSLYIYLWHHFGVQVVICDLIFFYAVFRIGKSLDHLKKASRTIHLADPVLRFGITLAQINRSFYLLFDHVIWAGRVGLVKVDTDYWKTLSSKFWFVALILGLARDAYELLLAYQLEKRRQQETSHSREEPSSRITILTVLQHNPSVILDAIKNGADFFIPCYHIGLINLPSGIIGLLGAISSLIGLYTIWNENIKLKYA